LRCHDALIISSTRENPAQSLPQISYAYTILPLTIYEIMHSARKREGVGEANMPLQPFMLMKHVFKMYPEI